MVVTDRYPNNVSLKKALGLYQSLESMLEQRAKEGMQVLLNDTNKLQVPVEPQFGGVKSVKMLCWAFNLPNVVIYFVLLDL